MAQNESKSWFGMIMILAFVAVVGIVVGTRQAPNQNDSKQDESTQDEQTVQTTTLTSISYQGQDGKTAFELLDASHELEVQQSDIGTLVTKIDGVGGESDAFWLYYVNGEPATVAADKYQTKSGDLIEWRYERF